MKKDNKTNWIKRILILLFLLILCCLGLKMGTRWIVQRYISPQIEKVVTPKLKKKASILVSDALEQAVNFNKGVSLPKLSEELLATQKKIHQLVKKGDTQSCSTAANLYLDACVVSPKTGYNALIKFPYALANCAEDTLISKYKSGSMDVKRCSASVLTRHSSQNKLKNFWISLLNAPDEQLRWYGITRLSNFGDINLLPDILRQALEIPNLKPVVASSLRDYKGDKRVVPFLNSLLNSKDEWIRKRAQKSLKDLGFADEWKSNPDNFVKEIKWWGEFVKNYKPLENLKAPWVLSTSKE